MKTTINHGISKKANLLFSKNRVRNIFIACMVTALLVFSGMVHAQQTNTFVQGTNTVLGYNPMAGDVDGDGDQDLVAENANNGFTHVYLNNGTGSFTDLGPIPGMRYTESMALGDLDGDGDADLVIPYNEISGITSGEVWLSNGNGTFSLMPGHIINHGGFYGFVTKICDINLDGKKDIIYIGIHIGNYVFFSEVWLNTGTTGSPAFTLSNEFNNYISRASADIGDLDGDGDLDIVSGGNSWGVEICTNNAGVFTPTNYINDYAGSTSLSDWDQDGDLDLLYYDGYNNSGLKVNLNDGLGNFQTTGTLLFNNAQVGYPLNYAGNFMLLDVNNDGFKDAVISDGNGVQGTRVLINNGCSFVMQSYVLASGPSYGMTNADFNGDGFKEVFSGSYIFVNDLLPVIPVPFSHITSSIGASIPSGSSATLNAVANNGGTARWWDDAVSGSLLGTGPSYITPVLTSNATYYVSAINSNGCESARIAVNVSIVSCTPASISGCPANQQMVAGSGCSATASYTVNTSGLPAPAISYNFSGATGGSGSGDGSDAVFNVGVTSVTVTASNSCGNAVCTFTVTVTDNIAPTISGVGANSVISCPVAPSFSSPSASDDCGSASLTISDATSNGNCPGTYSITRTWTATDASGNTSIASQTISVTDNTGPVISGVGANQTITSPATPVWSNPSATDACSSASMTLNTTSVLSGTSTVYTRTWTATDACGNSSSASQTITVNAPVSGGCPSCGPNKVSVCHKAGKINNTLCISSSALAAHLAHGDVCGPCAQARMAGQSAEEILLAEDLSSGNILENFPDPFVGITTLRFVMQETTHAKLEVYDLSGKLIKVAFNGDVNSQEEVKVEFNGSDLSNGMYIYKLITPAQVLTGKMILVKE